MVWRCTVPSAFAVCEACFLDDAQGQAQLTRRMAVRPASLASKAHRRLTAALDRRHVKFNRVQRTVTVLDPKKAKSDLEKDQEARIRSRCSPRKDPATSVPIRAPVMTSRSLHMALTVLLAFVHDDGVCDVPPLLFVDDLCP